MNKVSIYIAYHKESHFVQNEVYVPIQVGRALSNKVLPNIIGDDTGDNISRLNPTYCELTATYWAWKNDKDSDYIGICHYRRFFSCEKINGSIRLFRYIKYLTLKTISFYKPGRPSIYWTVIDVNGEKQLKEQCDRFSTTIRQKIRKQKGVNIYAPEPIKYGNESVYLCYSKLYGAYQINFVKKIIEQDYPALFPTLLKILNGSKMCYGNMFIMPREMYDEYCTIVFDVLQKHRQFTTGEEYDHNKVNIKCFERLSGYIAEIITATFIAYYRLKKRDTVKYLSVINYHDGSGRSF
jgi:hypothetical protein